MATDQGKTSNMNGLAIAAGIDGQARSRRSGSPPSARPTRRSRSAALPAIRAAICSIPTRRTPIHDWAASRGAVFEDVGLWKRAWYFPRGGEDMHAAVARECRAVRDSVGIFDATTLGKIEVVGPDAAEFMNRLYTNAWTKLEPGRLRYGLMLNEAGFVMDDGVIGRLAPDRFHVTTTTGGAPRVLAHMEDYLQTEFTDLKVWLTSTTEQWAVIAVQGPHAREVIEPLVEGIDISPARQCPHMSVREGSICGVPTRLFRVSFTGELGFEINVPADYGQAVWEAIWRRARSTACRPMARRPCTCCAPRRATSSSARRPTALSRRPISASTGPSASRSPISSASARLTRPDMLKPDRKQLVGLLTADPDSGAGRGRAGHRARYTRAGNAGAGTCHLGLCQPCPRPLDRHGPGLGRPNPHGRDALCPDAGRRNRRDVTDPIFLDKDGSRLDG